VAGSGRPCADHGPTAIVTSGFWLIMHVAQGWPKLLYLVPLAVALSLVRHYTGTVRATILLHGVNNARSVVASLVAWQMV
jgi:membrane protease YdiL (CAAX protease family)